MQTDAQQEYATETTPQYLQTEDNPVANLWQPRWKVDVGHGCELGVAVDDGCYVLLYPHGNGQWRLGTHIPAAVAQFIGALATLESKCSIEAR